jgi:hypothetical protein
VFRFWGIHLLSASLLGPAAEEPVAIPRAQQSVPPVGLVPHAAPEFEIEAEDDPETEEEKEPEVAVVYMPAKKKAIGVKSPTNPLGCEDPVACKRLLIGGGIMAGLATATIVTGAVLHTRPDRIISNDPAYMRSTRAVGVIVMTAGIAVGISATLLLVASLRDRRVRQRDSAWLREGRIRF